MSHLPLAGSCTVAVSLSAVFRYPYLAFAAWAGDEFFPRSSAGAHGVQCPSQVCSRGRVDAASLRPRAHMPVRVSPPHPIIFVGLIRRPSKKGE